VYPIARRLSPVKYRTTVLSILETSFGLGTMSGPFLGGLLYEYGGFSLPFLVCGTLLGANGVLATITIVMNDMASKKKKNEDEDEVSASDLPSLSLWKVVQKPKVILPLLIVVLSGMATEWYQPTLEPFLSTNYNVSGFKASLFLIIDGATYAAISPLIGIILDKSANTRLLLMCGCSGIALSFFIIGPLSFTPELSLIQIGISLAVHGIGMGASFIGSIALLNSEVEKLNEGNADAAMGISTCLWITAECFGSAVGSLLGGSTYDIWGWDISCLCIGLLEAGAAIFVLITMCENQKDEDREETKTRIHSNIVNEKTPLLQK